MGARADLVGGEHPRRIRFDMPRAWPRRTIGSSRPGELASGPIPKNLGL